MKGLRTIVCAAVLATVACGEAREPLLPAPVLNVTPSKTRLVLNVEGEPWTLTPRDNTVFYLGMSDYWRELNMRVWTKDANTDGLQDFLVERALNDERHILLSGTGGRYSFIGPVESEEFKTGATRLWGSTDLRPYQPVYQPDFYSQR